ncbi:hypothetical protein PHYSODRAFT_338539 [Phytophthora sojae]|uniref:Pectinesterase n=1 Tax=Phytophthora sojae (strain P6497) TaxID=1094619 RepID=G5A2C5_PHYSP|nr:hypothetical protein PHYSODRAFT_338539 [Phytophthora sojae]EGZ09816.1 hypothetical protein PHYSODRAFT_338539 [Phytophthora sojae]|eukprot:XP_009534677.1 hypothetical protein PHYSODRAFT_338539 [Phytophthora sojae]
MRIFALPLVVLTTLIATASAGYTCAGPDARTQPPVGSIVVDPTGAYSGSFRNGYTCNTKSYADNEVTITQAKAQKDILPEIKNGRNSLTSTLLLKSNNVRTYNLNVANTAGKFLQDGQAVAVDIEGDNYGFYACNISGYQDTVYANKGREVFARSYISGAVDFVFGSLAAAWFDPSYFVFNNTRVFGSYGNSSSDLGRPWHPYSRVVWQNSELGDSINTDGWQIWDNSNSTANVSFLEFNNRGPGAATDKRVSFGKVAKADVDITELFGENYKNEWWVDHTFL